MVTQNLRGELTAGAEVELQDQDLAAAIAHKLQMTSGGELERLRETLYPAMLCAAAESGDIQRIDTLRAFVSGNGFGKVQWRSASENCGRSSSTWSSF